MFSYIRPPDLTREGIQGDIDNNAKYMEKISGVLPEGQRAEFQAVRGVVESIGARCLNDLQISQDFYHFVGVGSFFPMFSCEVERSDTPYHDYLHSWGNVWSRIDGKTSRKHDYRDLHDHKTVMDSDQRKVIERWYGVGLFSENPKSDAYKAFYKPTVMDRARYYGAQVRSSSTRLARKMGSLTSRSQTSSRDASIPPDTGISCAATTQREPSDAASGRAPKGSLSIDSFNSVR